MSAIEEFWFWTILIIITAIFFRIVARNYKTVEYLHDS